MTLAEQVIKGGAQSATAQTGALRAAARLITLLENGAPEAAPEMNLIYPHTGRAAIIGVTGAPGTGKSSLAGALIKELRGRGKTAGVIAIDPSSAVSGGAMLGDRVRMQEHSTDPGVFIRSLATRGWAGGLSKAALGAVHVLDALGMDYVFIETVGAGQVEVDIAAAADTTLVVLNPGAGDDIQTLKAGILEAADIFVINKADRDGAPSLKADLETIPQSQEDWKTPVVLTTAIEGKGIQELVRELEKHREYLTKTGQISERRKQRLRLELLELLEAAWRGAVDGVLATAQFNDILNNVVSGKTSLQRASAEIFDTVFKKNIDKNR